MGGLLGLGLDVLPRRQVHRLRDAPPQAVVQPAVSPRRLLLVLEVEGAGDPFHRLACRVHCSKPEGPDELFPSSHRPLMCRTSRQRQRWECKHRPSKRIAVKKKKKKKKKS